MSALALFGGKPVRKEPYPPHDTMIGPEEEREVLEVLRSGNLSGFSATPTERFLGGPKVRALEAAFAEKFCVKYAVSTNSATSALHCALLAIGIGPGHEVITTPFTMCATAAAIVSNGAKPVFADIEGETFGLDVESVESLITERTRAILAVNLFGHPCELLELARLADDRGLRLIEDNAQSPGAVCNGRLAGTWGEIGVQSLNFHKAIQTGEGGIALTDSIIWDKYMKYARNHGEALSSDFLGGNHRMTELSAAVGLAQLRKLDDLTVARQRLAGLLTEALDGFDFLAPPSVAPGCTHVYYLYPMRYTRPVPRSLFVKAMRAEGISISGGYTTPTHLLRFYRDRYGYADGLCQRAEFIHNVTILTTDICKHPNTEREVIQFAEAAKKIADHIVELRHLD